MCSLDRYRVPRASDGATVSHDKLAPQLAAAHLLMIARFLSSPSVGQPNQARPTPTPLSEPILMPSSQSNSKGS